jgi:hypothetical protein
VRKASLNWNNLGYIQQDLSELEDPFAPEEIKQTITSLPHEKAPSPDSFIGLFYKKCWTISSLECFPLTKNATTAFN